MKKLGYKRIDGKLVKVELAYQDPEVNKVYGYGEPMELASALKLINQYKSYRSKIGPKDFENKLGFIFGKNALLSILSQENCEGIKIYFGVKEADDISRDSIHSNKGITLVAIGIDNKENEVKLKKETIINYDPEIKDDMDKLANESSEVYETVPPVGGKFIKAMKKFLDK